MHTPVRDKRTFVEDFVLSIAVITARLSTASRERIIDDAVQDAIAAWDLIEEYTPLER